MELILPLTLSEGQGEGQEKIDSSAEALRVRHHPFIFPSEIKTPPQRCVSNCADKNTGNGEYLMSLRARLVVE